MLAAHWIVQQAPIPLSTVIQCQCDYQRCKISHPGRRGPAANPIAHVLAAIGESPEMIEYKGWNVMLPEGTFYTEVPPPDTVSHNFAMSGLVIVSLRMSGLPDRQLSGHAGRECAV